MSEHVKARPPWLAQMEDIFETLSTGVIVADLDGWIVFANQAFSDMIGFPADDLFGRTADDFYCGADLEFLMAKRQSDVTSAAYEFHLPRVDGKPLPVIISARRIKSPQGHPFVIVIFTDISEQKQHQRELRKANKLLEEHGKQLQTELLLAARVQQSLVPHPLVWGNVTVETYYEPVHTIGGDFGLVAPNDDLHLNLLVCDVSGHGIGSALIANRIYTETVALLERQENLNSMMSLLNRMVMEHIQLDGFFFTMAAARLDHQRRLTFAGAGHPPGIWLTPGGECRFLESTTGLLGAFDGEVTPEEPVQEIDMSPGDRFMLCTDGLTEVFNKHHEMLGSDGLLEIVRKQAGKPLAEMTQAILNEVAAWRHGPVTDDMSLVLLEVS